MLKWLLTGRKKPEAAPPPDAPSLQKRVQRLEIDLEDVMGKLEAVWARQRKVEGAVHGMRGASRRHPQRDGVDETLEEFRDRMAREGRLSVARGESQHGEH